MQEVDQSCIESVNAAEELAEVARSLEIWGLPIAQRGDGKQNSIVLI
jgi:hypothetical protein